MKVVTGLLDHSLTDAGGPAPTYPAMMRYDTRLIVGAHEDRAATTAAANCRRLVDGVSVRYGGDAVLHEVSLRVAHGAQVAVVGPNGAGNPPSSRPSSACFRAQRPHPGARATGGRTHVDPIAYVPQREEIDWRFPVDVTDVVMMGRYGRTGWLRRPGPGDRRAVAAALALMDLTSLARRPISESSGGQQQRVFLARALAQEPHVLLLDEPFTGVDVTARQKTLDVLTALRDRNVTVLVSTHDLELAATRFEHIVLLNRRVIAQGPPSFVLTTEHIAEAFGAQAHVFQGMVVIDECCSGLDDGEEYRHDHGPHTEPR